ncbi:Fumitremorgin C synthase [Madurella mycetomatis]|uniref:Fumitremorgin C synthase n=1 Tax=Madurella mycetomatis TaxID=100816 RepID=A0A175WDU5_9PEZI|nr:Fumitremorgin C synthase [Madurella mycetomatis]
MSALLSLAIVGMALLAVHKYMHRQRIPPGIRPLPGLKRLIQDADLPFVGRVHDIPADGAWLKFYEWSKQCVPICQMEIFGTVHVWISSQAVAHDLLPKRALIYSDRPVIPNLPDNRTSGDYLALLGQVAETWKRQRKLCNHLIHSSTLASLPSYPTLERDRLLYLLYQDPSKYLEWIEQFTTRTVSRLCWGTPLPSQVLRHTTFGLLEAISPPGALPNIISFLRHVPAAMSPWKRKESARHALEDRLFKASVNFVKHSMASHHTEPSFIHTFMESKESQDEKEWTRWGDTDEVRHVVGVMVIAGALTIGSPIQSFLLAICHYPQCVSEGRCPQWDDRAKPPMLRAVVKEVIRWRPPVATGFSHAVEKDDIYNGYFIPAGATIHALEWGITHPSFPTYREPLTQYPDLNGYSQFGFGRRTCQGVSIVEQDLFLSMAGVAWAFDIRKKRDPLTDAEPVKFPFDALPRSREKVAAMREMYEAAQGRRCRGPEMDISQFRPDLGDKI